MTKYADLPNLGKLVAVNDSNDRKKRWRAEELSIGEYGLHAETLDIAHLSKYYGMYKEPTVYFWKVSVPSDASIASKVEGNPIKGLVLSHMMHESAVNQDGLNQMAIGLYRIFQGLMGTDAEYVCTIPTKVLTEKIACKLNLYPVGNIKGNIMFAGDPKGRWTPEEMVRLYRVTGLRYADYANLLPRTCATF
jgi:hypothetical protein